MQYELKEYDREIHDRFRALIVKQPYANRISEGQKTVELRTRKTSFRGDLVICSSLYPEFEGLENGCTICLVELYDVKKVSDLTDEEIKKTCLHPKAGYWKHAKYAYMLRNPRKLIEFPVKGQLGIWNLIYTKETIIPYPIFESVPEKKMNFLLKAKIFGFFILFMFTIILIAIVVFIYYLK